MNGKRLEPSTHKYKIGRADLTQRTLAEVSDQKKTQKIKNKGALSAKSRERREIGKLFIKSHLNE